MGNVFARPMSQLAEWILALRDVAPPEHIDAVELAIQNCRATARAIERAARRLSSDNTNEQNATIMADVRTEVRTLTLQVARLEDLVKEVRVEPKSRSDGAP